MGRISDEELNNSSNIAQKDTPYYWYFGLAKEGDSAIIRIMDDTRDDLEPLATHPVRVKGKYRRISCLRNSLEPLEMCPLCSANVVREKKVYVHLIEYMTAADGSIIPTPKVWERPMGYMNELKEYMEDYQPLSDTVFKVKRSGQGPSTRYALIPLNPANVDLSKYPKDTSFFKDYRVLGVNVQIRDAENILKGISDGTITYEVQKKDDEPVEASSTLTPNATPQPANVLETPADVVIPPVAAPELNTPNNIPYHTETSAASPVAPVVPPVAPSTPNNVPWGQSAPRRTYTPSSPFDNSAPTSGFRPIRNV